MHFFVWTQICNYENTKGKAGKREAAWGPEQAEQEARRNVWSAAEADSELSAEIDPETGFQILLAVQEKVKALEKSQQPKTPIAPWFSADIPRGKHLGAEAK